VVAVLYNNIMLQSAKYIGSGLATIGLVNTLTSKLLKPDLTASMMNKPVRVTDQANKAISALQQMEASLQNRGQSVVLDHLCKSIDEMQVQQHFKIRDSRIVPNNSVSFPNNIIQEGSVPKIAGAYAFFYLLFLPYGEERRKRKDRVTQQ